MRAVLNKIFLQKLGVGKFVFSGVAFLVGFTMVLLALQGYIKVRDYLNPAKNKSNFIVINKEVVMAHTLLGGRAQFSAEEIEDLRHQPFVEDLGVFKSSSFEVVAHAGGEMGLYTELFFESVPTRFIDNCPSNFRWQEGSDDLPIIISQDFLDLYNFGFAIGKGAPQLSKSTIQLVPVNIDISGDQGRKTYSGKVVGFSERIPTVLVPEDFLMWANAHVGNPEGQNVSRVIIKMKSDGANELETYLRKKNLIVSDEKMKLGKILTALNIFMAAALLIGFGFVVFSLVIILLNFSLIVSQAKEEVSLLLQLGYSGRQLVLHLTGYLLAFMMVVITLSGLAWWFGNNRLVALLNDNGMSITSAITPQVGGLAIGFILVFFVVSYFTIDKLIRKQQ